MYNMWTYRLSGPCGIAEEIEVDAVSRQVTQRPQAVLAYMHITKEGR
jgi:hypothetical protein